MCNVAQGVLISERGAVGLLTHIDWGGAEHQLLGASPINYESAAGRSLNLL